jgi:hypothetical protein
MITMLYEKTLSRKVVSVSVEARADENVKVNGNGIAKKPPRSCWAKVVGLLGSPFRSKKAKALDKSKELASMGKIMNLMR